MVVLDCLYLVFLYFVLFAFCYIFILSHLHFVTIALCLICILLHLHFVGFAFCLFLTFCHICILSRIRFLDTCNKKELPVSQLDLAKTNTKKSTLELSATIRAQTQRFRKWKKHWSRTVTKVWLDSQTQQLLIDGQMETISATPEPESLPRSYEYAAKTTRCKYFMLR